MRDLDPSRTALRVAMHRAAHQILDEPRVFSDPIAVRIVGEDHMTGFLAIGPEDMNARYFRDRTDDLRVRGFTRIMNAQVRAAYLVLRS